MIGNRRYWKACAKQFLSGKWGIAILAGDGRGTGIYRG